MNLFNETDKRLLEKTLELREKILDNYVSKKLPETAKDIDSITNLLESIDRSILGKAKLKIEENNTRNMEETKNAMIEILMNLHKNNTNTTISNEKEMELKIDNNFSYRDEEFTTHIDTLTIEDFENLKKV